MKKKIQAIACAAVLAVGGFNAYTALGSGNSEPELQIDNVELVAEAEHGWLYNLFHPHHLDYEHVEYLYSFMELDDHWDKKECMYVSGRGSDRCVLGNLLYVRLF